MDNKDQIKPMNKSNNIYKISILDNQILLKYFLVILMINNIKYYFVMILLENMGCIIIRLGDW